MAVFLGTTGNIKLRRGSTDSDGAFADQIKPDDVNVTLARVGFAKSLDNLVTGDRLEISTTDARGLACFTTANWGTGLTEKNITGFVNVNALGGLRFFPTFSDAVNNNRLKEYKLKTFTGNPIDLSVAVKDTTYNVLGNITNFELNTSREAVDTTALADKFKNQYTAGLISGSGRIECLFDYKSTGITETPVMLLQTVQRVEIGSHIELALYLVDKSTLPSEESVFYQLEAVITQSGVSVAAGDVITCSIDFLTTGEIRLLVGEPTGFILTTESGNRLLRQNTVNYLLTGASD